MAGRKKTTVVDELDEVMTKAEDESTNDSDEKVGKEVNRLIHNDEDLEKYQIYFDEYAEEDVDDIITVCQTASKIIYDKFRARFNDPRLLASVYSKIYEAILLQLQDFETKYKDFQINLCGRLQMGYSTLEDDDDEKQGNFMIYIRHLNSKKKDEELDDPQADGKTRAVLWKTENNIENPKIVNEISARAEKMIRNDLDVNLSTADMVMPIFITTYETLVNYLSIKRREEDKFEKEINFISCFYITARESDGPDDIIDIRPNINAKLTLKNDAGASSKYE